MSRKELGAIVLTIVLGLVTNWLWEWVKQYTPLPNTNSTATSPVEPRKSTEPNNQLNSPPEAPQPLIKKSNSGPAQIATALGQRFPSPVLIVFCVFFSLYLIIFATQTLVQTIDIFGKFCSWIGDEWPPFLWPFVFSIGFFLLYFWMSLVTSFYSLGLWILAIL
jgi:hypothetical protein